MAFIEVCIYIYMMINSYICNISLFSSTYIYTSTPPSWDDGLGGNKFTFIIYICIWGVWFVQYIQNTTTTTTKNT